MNAKELRIGSYYQAKFNMNTEWNTEYNLDYYGMREALSNAIILKPIEITPEWFMKLGFVQINDNYVKSSSDGNFHFQCLWDGVNYEVWISQGNAYGDTLQLDCEFVHILQNIFFNISNEELTITS